MDSPDRTKSKADADRRFRELLMELPNKFVKALADFRRTSQPRQVQHESVSRTALDPEEFGEDALSKSGTSPFNAPIKEPTKNQVALS
jgi:hypothetical protein